MIIFRLVFQTAFLALGQIWSNKIRSLLTTLGIIIGVMAVIAVISGLKGLQGFVLNEFATFGVKKVYVWGYVPEEKRTTISWSDVKMTPYEINQIVERSPGIEMATVEYDHRYDVEYGKIRKTGVEIDGVWPQWHEIENRSVLIGRELSQNDCDNALPVCLINEFAIEELDLPKDPTGEFLLIKGRRFLIIGVLETKEMSAMFGGGQPETQIVMPYETLYNLDPYRWRMMIGQLTDVDQADNALQEIRFVMRKIRNLDPEDEDTFRIEILQNNIEQFNSVAGVITAGASVVVAISLLVGGIGIMNIMLVSVSERTREIGLRKAVGARPGVILTQFLVEAVTLCMVGGLVGWGIGEAITLAMRSAPDLGLGAAEVPSWAVALAFGFCATTGVVFGMFPAVKAARLNPIDALRHE